MARKNARGGKSHRPRDLSAIKYGRRRIKALRSRLASIYQSIIECQYEKNRVNHPSLNDSTLNRNAGYIKLLQVMKRAPKGLQPR